MKCLQNILITVLALLTAVWLEALYVTSGPITVAWDHDPIATSTELKMEWVSSSGSRHIYDPIEVTGDQAVIERPRGGFFVVHGRHLKVVSGVNPDDGLPWANVGEVLTSEWVTSIDPEHASVDGIPRGWRVFFEIPPPSGGGVD